MKLSKLDWIVIIVILLLVIVGVYLVQPLDSPECRVVNCHGAVVECGLSFEPMICTSVYLPGDGCRKFAGCEVVDGECQRVAEPMYQECVECITACEEDDWECIGNCEY